MCIRRHKVPVQSTAWRVTNRIHLSRPDDNHAVRNVPPLYNAYIFQYTTLVFTLYERTYVRTYLLTPWCRALLQQLTGLQLVKKSPAFHRTRRFITALTSVRHLSLTWASPTQSIYPHPTSWRSILILSTHLRLGLPSGIYATCYINSLTLQKVVLTALRRVAACVTITIC